MPVLCATVSSLPRPNIFRYQVVSISRMSVALFRCWDCSFPDVELRLSWELLRALDPLREATECLRWMWGGWTPPPLLRAASMVPDGVPSAQGQRSDGKVKRSGKLQNVSFGEFLAHSSLSKWSLKGVSISTSVSRYVSPVLLSR